VLPVFTAAEMRALDARAIRDLGIPGPRLMEAAGSGAADLIARWHAPIRGKSIVAVCGKGNNGGDGFVVARRLQTRGAKVRVLLVGRRADVRGDAAAALARWRGRTEQIATEADVDALARALDGAAVVVDALLGTGGTGPARGPVAAAIEAIDRAGQAGAPIISLDLPSGLGGDDGAVSGAMIERNDVCATWAIANE